jgi:hypothetical protein
MGVVTATYRFSGAGEDFGPRLGRRLVILHTFENADPAKNKVVDALAGARWQDRADTFGSYNRLIAVDGVVSCVPDANASGGVNPASSFFKPRAWLYERLPASVVNNPNAFALQLCAMGQRAWYDANGWPPAIIDGFARSILEEEAHGSQVISNHADFQPGNRSDAGVQAMALTLKRLDELRGDMQFWKPVQEDWWTVPGTVFWDGDGTEKSFTTRERVTSVAEATDGHRLVKYGTNELLVIPRTGLTPISGTRVPTAPAYGFPPVTGYTQAQLDAEKAKSLAAGKSQMKAKAIVAAENHEATIRALT